MAGTNYAAYAARRRKRVVSTELGLCERFEYEAKLPFVFGFDVQHA